MHNLPSFDFSQDYILEDASVLLRPLQPDDLQHLLPFSLQEPELWHYSLVQANSPGNLQHYMQLALAGRQNKQEYPFIVFDKMQQAYAGSTRFYDIQLAHHTLQLGYTWYGKKHQGTGLNKHCKYLLLQFAFEQMQMERVEFRADNNNKKSIAAMKSIGCVEEGVLRSNGLKPDGTRRDSIVLSILKEEWLSTVRNTLEKKLTKKLQ